ncbi:MAG: hypothetical protein CFE45_20035 [Burkholderiales bacterium PBB5]|nr:MAG: hypothetical protein CFE45_20035 [Burkholderiales bacterium PBB5]
MRRQFLHQLLRIATRRVLAGLLLAIAAWGVALPALAQGVELKQIRLQRQDNDLTLDFSTRLTLGAAIEDALHRGVPMYFNAQATVYRNRWYWRDERIARVNRTWRLAWQPLTASWRLSLGGLSQGYSSLSEALATLSRVSGWRLAELDKIEAGERYYVEFSFKLDNSQLPQPMQIDLGGDWKLGIERSIRLE